MASHCDLVGVGWPTGLRNPPSRALLEAAAQRVYKRVHDEAPRRKAVVPASGARTSPSIPDMRSARQPFGLAVILLALLAAIPAGCGGGGSGGGNAATVQTKPSRYVGGVVSPRQPAPPLDLRDYLGRPVTLSDSRGKVVLVTFIYTHCPDVCPLIVGNLKAVRARLGGQAQKLQIVAVSTDPAGDTPRAVAAFLRAHGMTGKMRYVIGDHAQLQGVWSRWGVAAKPDKVQKLKGVYRRNGVRGRAEAALVEHSALVYGISASGLLTTLYAANFRPEEIVHDFPLLAAS